VLLIDDELPVHLAIHSLVNWTALGLKEPQSAYNGMEGLKCMEHLRPDIAFVDMNMPLMGGVDFLTVASRNHPYCQYIVVSGYDDFRYAKAAIRAGAVDYLLKPVDRTELERALRKAILRLPEKERMPKEQTPTEVIANVHDYISRHYQKDISVEELAERFFFSKEYLTRLFRNQYGCAIYEYVLQLRMNNACEYLMDSGLTIQEIAEKMGYSSANYFGKAFKRRYGQTPSEFRDHQEGEQNGGE